MKHRLVCSGFAEDLSIAVIRVSGIKGTLRASAFLNGWPMPLRLLQTGVEDILKSEGVSIEEPKPHDLFRPLGLALDDLYGIPEGEDVRLVALAAPRFDAMVNVILQDESPELDYLDLGYWWPSGPQKETRTEKNPGKPFTALYDALHKPTPEGDNAWLWLAYPAGDRCAVRFRATFTYEPSQAALTHAPLDIVMLGSDSKRRSWPVYELEDSVIAEQESGKLRRELTYSALVPWDMVSCCLWVWNRGLGRGVFCSIRQWMVDSRVSEFLGMASNPERDVAYDEWVRHYQGAGALDSAVALGKRSASLGQTNERDAAEEALETAAQEVELSDADVVVEIEETEPLEAPKATPHLSVLIAEDPLGEESDGEHDHGIVGVAAAPGGLAAALLRTRTSLDAQTYTNFDAVFVPKTMPLGIAGSHLPEDWRVVVGAGDVLEPEALARIAEAARREGARLVYGDEDVAERSAFGATHFVHARIKPAFSPDELYFGNGVGLPLAISNEVDVPDAKSVYELALAAFECGGVEGVAHVEQVLLHAQQWRPYALPSSADALKGHLERRGIAHDVFYVETNPTDNPKKTPGGFLHVGYPRPLEPPLISIIIPNRDQVGYLRTCVDSILANTAWPSYEIIVVENGSREDATLELYSELQAKDSRIKVVGWRGDGFNYSAIVNRGAKSAQGEFLCFLNNDTKVLNDQWLDELAGPLCRPEVGITGALLTFADGLVQHAGMMAIPNGTLGHQQQNLWAGSAQKHWMDGDDGYLFTLKRPVAYSMVTGACQMTRHAVFDELGGYDERFAVGYNDADYCLRAAEAGYETLFVPFARLHHREFGTRHREALDENEQERWEAERRIMFERHPQVFGRDPFLNRWMDPESRFFRLIRPSAPDE